MKLLVIGSGGREHCLVWKLSQSSLVDKIYCAPGNGGTTNNVDIGVNDIEGLLNFVLKEKIDLTVVGPETPLVEGIVDQFKAKGLKIFGPNKDLARLEGSKIFAKELMQKYSIPTANFKVFTSTLPAKAYIEKRGTPLVVKADGLAAGKGVFVCSSVKAAQEAIDLIMLKKEFGASGDRVIIEDCFEGEETSILVFTDGETIIPLVASQDHKRAFDRDNGPNTGGMGAYAPAPLVNAELFEKIMDKIFTPLIKGLKQEGRLYQGILYAGLMIQNNEPYVLEFNVRFGDPETQAILTKLKSDLAELMLKTVDGKLRGISLQWDERFCVCVVLASGGYPGNYQKDKEIRGLEKLSGLEDIFVFHAGTKEKSGFFTNGGRVLNISALGDTIKEAKNKAYDAIGNIQFENMFYRKDIGDKAFTFK